MSSPKQIATQIIDIIGEPYNHILFERVKDLVIQELAWLVKSECDKLGYDEDWIQYAQLSVIKVDPIDHQKGESDKRIYRSTVKMPKRIRLKGAAPIMYVGTADRMIPFLYVTNYAMAIRMKHVSEIGDVPKYSLRNGYLECYVNDANLKIVTIGHAFVNSQEISNETSTNIHVDFDEDDELLISEDIIQLLKERILKRDLSVIKPSDDEVNVSSNEDTASKGTR